MEMFIKPKELVKNSEYQSQKDRVLETLTPDMIEKPLLNLVNGFNSLPQCFTLQCCYGHFLYKGQNNPNSIEPLPINSAITSVEYRIAYIALCIENSDLGRMLLNNLKAIPSIDSSNIQFGCANWFWKRQVNSYALQVEPERYKDKDRVTLDFGEALKIEKVKNKFFKQLELLLAKTPITPG